MQAEDPPLVLASASSARAFVLTSAGLRFQARPANIDEAAIKRSALASGRAADATALVLAETKARRIAAVHADALVIGADQLLVCGERWFDKPRDRTEAGAHLRALRGRTHTLMTAIACVHGDKIVWRHVAKPGLVMRDFSDAFLDAYLAAEGDAVTSSVGAYRLEGLGIHLFEEIHGEHAAILGIPLLPLLAFLRDYGILAP
jgi:septum formation protein